MTYAADHAGALADLTEAGSAVTFTTVTPGTHDAATGTFASPTSATVTGYAMKGTANGKEEERFRAASAVLDKTLVLVFTPSTFGASVTPKASVVWGSTTYSVLFVTSVEPKSGEGVLFRVGCVR